jgi:hypothetical protein
VTAEAQDPVGAPAGEARIRPLERDDLPAVASLYERVARSGSPVPAPGLAAHFASTFLDHPWADPELPSLVGESADGSICGFIGSHVRRFVFDGSPIRVACGGQLVADPTARNRAVGFFLLREFMAGEQDLAITDTAVEATRAMWTRIGGRLAPLESISWFRVLRPVSFGVEYLLTRTDAARRVGEATGVAARVEARRREAPVEASTVEPSELVRQLPAIVEARLRPDYDEAFLVWLFAELAAVASRGSLVARLVRTDRGRPAGWYVYYLRRGGLCDVLQVVAARRGVDRVLDDLFAHARRNGAALLRGRLEPSLVDALARRRCVLRYNGAALVHSRHPEILRALGAGEALLTRLDGEWWMGHHLEPFAG